MYRARYLEDVILRINKKFKVLYLAGPRQVGKTTLLKHLSARTERNYVSLDDLDKRSLAQNDPGLFLQQYPAPLLIDEAQYAPQLFPYIKIKVDASTKKGQYWLTGSQQFSLMKNVTESLAGRVGILNLLGLSRAEEKEERKKTKAFLPGSRTRKSRQAVPKNIHDLFKRILRGSFPELLHKDAPPVELFYNSYLQTYIDRDLRDIFKVAKIETFHKFLQLCAARTGQVLNMSDLARDTGISVTTVSDWLGILTASSQIFLLQPYWANFSKRLVKAPKLYFLDTGLAAYLTKWKTPEAAASGAMAGAFLETFVVAEIIKSYWYRGELPALYYYRDKEGNEVDLLIEKDDVISPIEIKLAATISKNDLKGIDYLRRKIPNAGKGAIISLYPEQLSFDKDNECIPATMIN
ncbi:MAG: ATP-binding protein [Candidatus Margulisiibacteriota bacterium]|jgi:hypothetical protein